MSEKKYCKLIMVTPDNNNKYYEMIWDGGSNFTVHYGRVELTKQTVSYPYYQWDKKYNEKVGKGYKDVTDMVAVEITEEKAPKTDIGDIPDRLVAEFLQRMKNYTDGLVSKTYSVKADKVSQKQVDQAQAILDNLAALAKAKKPNVAVINQELINLYTIIPRYMKNTRTEILPHIDLNQRLLDEQDNLDAMASQVKMITKTEKKKEEKTKAPAKQNLLDLLGITSMKEVKPTKEIEYLIKQASGNKIKAIFEVNKPWEDDRFNGFLKNQSNKATKCVFHGTKNPSVIPILEQGLKIRPTSNFQFSGKAYGNGNYFSEQFSTSIGYTDYSGDDKVMLIYEIHLGKVSKTSFNNYSECQKAGYDSFDGGWLRVAYNESQARIKYIVWLKK